MSNNTVTIALNAWNQYQKLICDASDAIWKIRTAFYAVASALLAAGYTSRQPIIYLFVLFVALLFLMLEGGHKRIQTQYIRKSLDIERTLTDLLVDESSPFLPSEGISTNLATPTASEVAELFSIKRFLFWTPYLAVSLVTLVLYFCDIHKPIAEQAHQAETCFAALRSCDE